MRVIKQRKLIVPFFKVKEGKVVETSDGGVVMKIVRQSGVEENAVDLGTGYLTFIDEQASVEILNASLEIK